MTLTPIRRALTVLAPIVLLTACGSTGTLSWSKPETLFGLMEPYRIDVVQGNVVTQEVVAQIQPGLGRMQVKEILGSPLLTDAFHLDRWDYVFTIHRQGVADQKRRVSVFFKQDVVDHFETEPLPSEREFVASIDKPLEGKEMPASLSEAEVAALPVPERTEVLRKTPQGAVRTYPPLENGSR